MIKNIMLPFLVLFSLFSYLSCTASIEESEEKKILETIEQQRKFVLADEVLIKAVESQLARRITEADPSQKISEDEKRTYLFQIKFTIQKMEVPSGYQSWQRQDFLKRGRPA